MKAFTALLMLLFVFSTGVRAKTVIQSLPFTADRNGETYVLESDLTSASSGIKVTGDGITILGNGHFITGASGNGVHFYRCDGSRARDLNLDWSNGTHSLYIDRSNSITVNNLHATGAGMEMWSCDGIQVMNSSFKGIPGKGGTVSMGLSGNKGAVNSVIKNCYFYAISPKSDQIIWLYDATNCRFHDNTVILEGAKSHEILEVQKSAGCVLSRNTWYINGNGKMTIRSESRYISLVNNTVYSESNGMWQHGHGTHNSYIGNRMFVEGVAFRLMEASDYCHWDGNLVVGPGVGFWADDSAGHKGNRLHNNTFFNTATGDVSASAVRLTFNTNEQRLEMRNNIILSIDTTTLWSEKGWSGLDADYNAYYQTGGEDPLILYDGRKYSSVSKFRKSTGLEEHGIDENPSLVLPDGTGNGDYTLQPGSPCIDAGDPAFPVPPGGGERIDIGYVDY